MGQTVHSWQMFGGAATHRSGNSSKRQLIEAATHRSGNSSKRQLTECPWVWQLTKCPLGVATHQKKITHKKPLSMS
jgi:hypothetical protein